MIKTRDLARVLAIGAVAVLPGCGMFGGHQETPAATPAAAPAPPPTAEAPPPQEVHMSRSLTRKVQAALKQNGLYKGAVDGIYGPGTTSAVSQFQQQNGMQGTGKMDTATLQALNITAPGTENMGGGMGGHKLPPEGAPGAMNAPGGTNNPGAMNNPAAMPAPGAANAGAAPPPAGGAGETNMNNSTNEPAAAAPPAGGANQ